MHFGVVWESVFMFRARLAIFIFFIFLFHLCYTKIVFAEEVSQVIVLNQVRGQECCEKGSIDAFQKQLIALQTAQLPATFVFRFDALRDVSFTRQMLDYPQFEKGLFLEITPDLAKEAGVKYEGSEKDWFTARNAYLVGYAVEDRKKLIDTSMLAFYNAFHTYPQTTAAWMIDAWSLQYLSKHYNIKAHELTRDQWGTDSYTLYGGPIGTSYQPSIRWPLIPSRGKEALPLTIFRQTLPDPLWNYGDTSSVFTSQPNDYALAGKTIEYFTKLLSQALLKQKTPTTVVLGLENSMGTSSQEEFIRQLQVLLEMHKNNLRLFTVKTAIDAASVQMPIITVQHGVDIFHDSNESLPETWWITTSTYRARIIHTSNQLLLTDLRVYNNSLEDPYAMVPTQTKHAYWIVPFAVDGSRLRVREEQTRRQFSLFRRAFSFIWRLPNTTSEPSDVFSDLRSLPKAIEFPTPTGSIELNAMDSAVKITYQSKYGKETIILTGKDLRHQGLAPPVWNVPQSHIPIDTGAELQMQSARHETILTPILLPPTTQTLLMPEHNISPVDPINSSFYINNMMARFGRNPVRIVLILRDASHLPTKVQTDPKLRCNKENMCTSTIVQYDSSKGMYYIDVFPPKPGVIKFSVELDGTTYPIGYAWSAENCMKQVKQCIKNPVALFGYVATSLFDRLQLHE